MHPCNIDMTCLREFIHSSDCILVVFDYTRTGLGRVVQLSSLQLERGFKSKKFYVPCFMTVCDQYLCLCCVVTFFFIDTLTWKWRLGLLLPNTINPSSWCFLTSPVFFFFFESHQCWSMRSISILLISDQIEEFFHPRIIFGKPHCNKTIIFLKLPQNICGNVRFISIIAPHVSLTHTYAKILSHEIRSKHLTLDFPSLEESVIWLSHKNYNIL